MTTEKQKWQEEADELINSIVTHKEEVKLHQESLDSDKQVLTDLLEKYNLNEYSGQNGKANFVRFEREGLVKDNIVDTVDGVNKGRITKINMGDLTKDIKVCFLNVRGFLGE
ncbi:hypothetical protein [Clostridium gasigenes]|uniref:hypothetical protein n=1 Tax=Clostridium gasigenes TaxID=94869 RepID=UPI001C0B718E|nr:hypothetical protein [Clostridium gasigenes]MBU3107173.1 hypothetical protein [Clostridium gasigenes]